MEERRYLNHCHTVKCLKGAVVNQTCNIECHVELRHTVPLMKHLLAGIWLVYGWYMVGIWLVYGWYMAGIWLVYGWYMAGI